MHFIRFPGLGKPQIPVTVTTADWLKFLGRDGQSGTPPLPQPGQVVQGYDNIWGNAEFILAYGVASLQIGDAVMIGANLATTRTVAATRGVVGISMAANTDSTALSWFAVGGIVPGRALAAAANVAMFTSATAGSLTNTVVATQQVTGAISLTALAATVTTKSVSTTSGSNLIKVADMDGLYVGMGITGTGIPGGTTITGLGLGGLMLGVASPPAGFIQVSANATATGNVTGTFANGAAFTSLHLARPVANNLG